ncbi:MAG TPA: response regulator [Candidatus Dormibacteraeota bacterium]|nr:response regulator [Candidatus Dormibacteraeota bacterium]
MNGVLIVDADPDVREVLTAVFVRRGFRVRGAGESDAAIRMARDEAPDALVTALDLKPIDGIELIEQVRALPGCGDLPVVIFSAATRHDVLDRIGDRPLARMVIVTKGGPPQRVVEAVHGLLGQGDGDT